MKEFKCSVERRGKKIYKIAESGCKDPLLCNEVFPEYIKFVCRKCDGEMAIDIIGMSYQEEYILTCKKCEITITLQAASG